MGKEYRETRTASEWRQWIWRNYWKFGAEHALRVANDELRLVSSEDRVCLNAAINDVGYITTEAYGLDETATEHPLNIYQAYAVAKGTNGVAIWDAEGPRVVDQNAADQLDTDGHDFSYIVYSDIKQGLLLIPTGRN